MKKLLLASALTVGAFTVQAQLPDNGVLTQSIVLTDINSNTHDIQAILDQDKPVILDLFAEWCGPCWNYHNTTNLKDLYNNYGPSATDELRVFAVETDGSTSEALLYGGAGTQGWDWVTGVPYPMANQNIGNIFNQSYYPTIVTVCPDRTVIESGQTSTANHYSIASNCGASSTATNDARILEYTGLTVSCGSVDASVKIQNFGSTTLTNATIKAYIGGNEVASQAWTGNLVQYDATEVDINGLTITQNESVTFTIDGTDDDVNNNSITETITFNDDPYMGELTLTIDLDNYPSETSWEFKSSIGATMAQGGPYNGQSGTITETVNLPMTGCFTFHFYDSYGDGLTGGGSYTLEDENGDVIGTGTSGFYEEAYSFNMASLSSNEDMEASNAIFNVYPNPTNGQANIDFYVENEEVTVNVINMVGQVVWNKNYGTVNGEVQETIDASNFEAGVYIISIETENFKNTKRLTVNK